MVHSQTFQCSGALLKAGGTDLLSVAATEAEGWMRTRGELSHPLDHDSRQFLPISSEFLPLNNWTVVLVWFSPTEPFCLESNYPVIILRCAWSWLFHFTCGSCISLIGSVMPSVEIQAAENILNRCHLLFTLRGEYRENTAPLDSKLGAHFIFERPRLPAWCQLEGWPYFWYPLLSTRVQSLASCWTPKGCSSGRLGRNIEVRLLIWCFPRAPFLFGFSFAFFLGRLFLRFYLFFFCFFFLPRLDFVRYSTFLARHDWSCFLRASALGGLRGGSSGIWSPRSFRANSSEKMMSMFVTNGRDEFMPSFESQSRYVMSRDVKSLVEPKVLWGCVEFDWFLVLGLWVQSSPELVRMMSNMAFEEATQNVAIPSFNRNFYELPSK